MIKFVTNIWTHLVILTLLLTAAFFYSDSDHDLRKRAQYLVFDGYNKIYPRQPNNDVVIVDLDENSLRKIGQWPWPRDILAQLITNINSLGAKAIAFDMVFAEEDRTSPPRIASRLPDDIVYQQAKEAMMSLPDNDIIFAKAIKRNGNIVTGFTNAGADETRRIPYQPVSPTFLLKEKQNIFDSVHKAAGLATNLEIFSQAAAGNGHFIAEPGIDGIIRSVSLFSRYDPPQFKSQLSVIYPILSLEALRVSIDPHARFIIKESDKKTQKQKVLDLDYQIKIGNKSIPIGADAKFWVYFRKMEESEYVPAHFLLNKEKLKTIKNRINDKIVLIGTSVEGLRDIRSTPLEQYIPGVEVHANVVEQILQEKYLKRPQFIDGAEAILLGVLGLSIIFLTPVINFIWLGLITFFYIGALFIGSWYAFVNAGLLLDPVYSAIVLFLLFIASSLLSFLRSEIDRRQIKNAFGHYISPVFMEELTKNPEKLKLGGEIKDLTVMFTDIRNFTTISETLNPEALVQLMNDFLTPMSDLVMENRGTIDKYMGDAMMAFWNAPLDDSEHARHACMTALKMNDALAPINEKLKQEAGESGKNPLMLSAGIGINTGACSIGNMGSKQRFTYSAMGDTVNLASRLEGQTKHYGVNIIVGQSTYRYVGDFAALELDLIQVVGRDEPVKIYTLLGDSIEAQSTAFKKLQAVHNSMLAAYRTLDFDCAAQDCKEAMDLAPENIKGYYQMYAARISELMKNPPADDWGGVYIAKSK